tara:strand:+ start:42 stop:443 length:402 start_codon:yes stop_codon:yes gene_type:complete
MGSLYAGPRTGMCAYTERDIQVGRTFYIAFIIEGRKVKLKGIVEIIRVHNNEVVCVDTKDKTGLWCCTVEDFLETANLYTDIKGNPFYRKTRKWWQFWKKQQEIKIRKCWQDRIKINTAQSEIEQYKKAAMYG